MNKNNKIIIIAVILALGVAAVFYFKPFSGEPTPASIITGEPPAAKTPLDVFAARLASKGAIMYGAEWCSHCQNQKKLFGESFKFVPYVECPDNPKLCLEKGIKGYPTWVFADGTVLLGEQSLEELSQASGCLLNQ